MNNNNLRKALVILFSLFLTTVILDRLIPEGIFLDGATYAAISRNMAIGKGSFWAPHYRYDWFFAEHPPLMFGLQALFFKVFGDHYLTEKIYCFVLWVVTALLIIKLWKQAISEYEDVKHSYILPVLMWTILPTVTWSYTNNILDTTMCLFDLIAVVILFPALRRGAVPLSRLLLAGVFTFCAVLTKGPVGLFVFGVPVAYALVYHTKDIKKLTTSVLHSIVILAVVAVVFIGLYQFPEPKLLLDRYLDEQLFAALSGQRELTGGAMGRFALFYDILMQSLPAIVLAIVLIIVSKVLKLNTDRSKSLNKLALFFLIVGLGASLPILTSLKQRSFYIIPSLPYYIIALGLYILPMYTALTAKYRMGDKTFRIFKMSAIIAGLGLTVYLGSKVNVYGRDREVITEVKRIGEVFPNGKPIGLCDAQHRGDFLFLAYVQRYNRMPITHKFYTAEHILVNKQWCGEGTTTLLHQMGYTPVDIGLENYDAYKRVFPLHFDFSQLNPVFPKVDTTQPSLSQHHSLPDQG